MVGTAFHLSFLFPSALLHSNCDSSKCAFKMMKIPCTYAGDYHHYLKNVHKWTNLACSCQTYHLGSLQIISILISSRSESTRTKSALVDITTRIYCTLECVRNTINVTVFMYLAQERLWRCYPVLATYSSLPNFSSGTILIEPKHFESIF